MASNDSDHCPLLLGLRDNMAGHRRFHFEAFWPKLEGFQEAVSVAWNSVPAGPCPFITLDRKFKEVSRGLQSWSDNKIGHINSQLVLAREILHQLEIAQDARVLTAGEIWLKNNLKKHCLALASLKRTIARLRSRINWLKDGDANTKLFQLHARHRKRKNLIGKLVSEDQIYMNHAGKASIIDDFYNSLLGTRVNRENRVDLTELGLNTHDLTELDLPFTVVEVWRTIEQLPPDKAPGPDGFTGRFYKSCWSIIKDDIMAAISAIWSRKFVNFKVLNAAFITLLPKVDSAEQPKDFRPISLVHSFAKLVTYVTRILQERGVSRIRYRSDTDTYPIRRRYVSAEYPDFYYFLEQIFLFCVLEFSPLFELSARVSVVDWLFPKIFPIFSEEWSTSTACFS
jgi:hypothetical protein